LAFFFADAKNGAVVQAVAGFDDAHLEPVAQAVADHLEVVLGKGKLLGINRFLVPQVDVMGDRAGPAQVCG